MNPSRDAILARLREALEGSSPRPRQDEPGAWPTPDPVAEFAEKAAEYRARVWRGCQADAPARLAEVIGAGRAAVAPGLDTHLIPPGAEVRSRIRPVEAETYAAAVTGCRLAIAETGTIVLDHGPDQGTRSLTLLPDHHICLVRTDQIVAGVAEAVAALKGAGLQTWISGPSATSDIELIRVEGVHGPRRLDILILEPDA
ncbi:MAG: LUD domain-containing protein [Fimbriimonadaceae bacterium]|nr:LUD domain-containing protein [Fimbriimonadaceae bacterium]